ncbi:MAG: hypothetical protein Q9214_007039, partial [Letrouitia sp. 1 TL-2023]
SQTVSSTCAYTSPGVVSLAGTEGFSENAQVYGFDFGGGCRTRTRTATEPTYIRNGYIAPASTWTEMAARPQSATRSQVQKRTRIWTRTRSQTSTQTETHPTNSQPLYTRLRRRCTPTATTAPQPVQTRTQLAVTVDASLRNRGDEESKSTKKEKGRRRVKFFVWLKEFGRKAQVEGHHK